MTKSCVITEERMGIVVWFSLKWTTDSYQFLLRSGLFECYRILQLRLRTVRKLFAGSSMVNSNCVTVQVTAEVTGHAGGLGAVLLIIVPLKELDIQQTNRQQTTLSRSLDINRIFWIYNLTVQQKMHNRAHTSSQSDYVPPLLSFDGNEWQTSTIMMVQV